MTLATEAVQIRYHTPLVTTATVTDTDGVAHWVCRTRHFWILLLMRSGWGVLVAQRAVEQVVAR